ncbi:hypothetical protein ACAG24_024780 [Mycobacterium sp. pW049]|uniref:hypothetical protein n=1 Tax=[Mycobacterium] bulgaricum TaxID=3238985 RepID=UPI00351B33FA
MGAALVRSGQLDEGLTTVSQTRPSIGAMLGFWMAACAVLLVFVMLAVETYVKRRWPSRSSLGLGALVGLSAILSAFVSIGVLVEGALHDAVWLRDDAMALWTGILCICGIFVYGAARAIPWVSAQRE